MAVITVKDLTKTFMVKEKEPGLAGSLRSLLHPREREKQAVAGVGFEVEPGEMLAFLGPNGAGKSTTIKMLSGILHPSSGSADVLGLCPWRDRKQLAYRIGCVFGQKSQLWYHLPPVDTFELMGRIYDVPKEDYRKRRDRLVERFELGPYLGTPVRKLSLGERMRCEIASALLHRPEVIFLDEPTIGLDVVVKQRIRELIRELNQEEGTTVFLTSHDPTDVEQLCKRVIVIHHGVVILDDSVTSMRRDFLGKKTLHLKLGEEAKELALPGVEVVKRKGTGIRLSVDTSLISMDELLRRIVQDWRILDITIEDPAMEEIITHIYSREADSIGAEATLARCGSGQEAGS
jgi:ABC-2 type transport system ATP-binding protein